MFFSFFLFCSAFKLWCWMDAYIGNTGQDIRIIGFKDIRIIRIGRLRHDWAG